MSNQAWLLANDSPQPVNPHAEDSDAATDARFLAGAEYAVPAFWLACFDPKHLVVVQTDDGELTTLVAPVAEARKRLARNEAAVRELFPHYAESWQLWRGLIDGVGQGYLKLDASEIAALADSDQQFREQLAGALAWFTSRDEDDLVYLLALSGIEEYDHDERAILFDEEEEDVETFLLGRLEDDA